MVSDPIGVVVDLVCDLEPTLERAAATAVVSLVATGRVTRRRLAQALVDNPSLLVDGRSPAPRVAGQLLIALRKAGAVKVSPPCCAGCGKPLRTFQRRGQDWFCSVCGGRRERCAGCGHTRPVNARDRQGRARCWSCPPDDGRDPIDLVVEVVAAVDPTIPATQVATAVRAVTSRAGHRRQLGWVLQERPELLTGAGYQASVPSVLRLIDVLCESGEQRIIRPACPHCDRVVALSKLREGLRICRGCEARFRAVPCVRCHAVREPASRDVQGRPLCPNCLVTDPANLETCGGCGRRRRVSVRGREGPLCDTCRPVPTHTCSICGRLAPCFFSQVTGAPWCRACSKRWARCTGCDTVEQVRGGTLNEPLCATCTRPDPSFWSHCPGCGVTAQLRSGLCIRCRLRRRLAGLLGDATGEVRPELQGLYDNLANVERPATVLGWLANSQATDVLGELGAGERPLTHAALDELPASKPLKHLRSVLVATGTLPARDEHMVNIEGWVADIIADRDNADEQQLLHHYAIWHQLRRLRGRTGGADITHAQAGVIKQRVRAVLGLLDWLAASDLTLSTARQGDFEAWLASDGATGRQEAGHFVRWANGKKLTRLEAAAVRWGGPSGVIDTETRWEQARWLLADETIDPDDRVAGLLILLYAQRPAAISRLSLAHIQDRDGQLRLHLGDEPVVVPAPLATLVRQLVSCRRGHAVLGDQGTSPWLFPGGQPGQPISPYQLRERLRLLGLRPARARSAALFQLATELPAAVLARMLGIHIKVAVQWQQASAGDWTSYAADVARRDDTPTGR